MSLYTYEVRCTMQALCGHCQDPRTAGSASPWVNFIDVVSVGLQIARQLLEVSALLGSLTNTMSSTDVPIDEVLSDLDAVSSVRMCLDLALTASSSRVACEELLDRAADLARQSHVINQNTM